MTDREKAIVMAYTGRCMLTGDKFQKFHKYIEDIMGRPIMIHEIGWLESEIKEKAKADFITLCADEPINHVKNGTPIPDNATNGDVIKRAFPNAEIKHGFYGIEGISLVCLNLNTSIKTSEAFFVEEWWNAPYKESEQKNTEDDLK